MKLKLILLLLLFTIPILPQKKKQISKPEENLDTLKIMHASEILTRCQVTKYQNISVVELVDSLKIFCNSSKSLVGEITKAYSQYLKNLKNISRVREEEKIMDGLELLQEFYSNQFRAESKYMHKNILFSGVVTEITKNIYNEKYFIINKQIQCFFKNDSDIERLSLYDNANIYGTLQSLSTPRGVKALKMDDCEIFIPTNYAFAEKFTRINLEISLDEIGKSISKKLNLASSDLLTNEPWDGVFRHSNGVVTITNVTQKYFDFVFEVVYPGGLGDITGRAIIYSHSKAAFNSTCEFVGGKGSLVFNKKRNRISVQEDGCVSREHGAGATFDGDYYKD